MKTVGTPQVKIFHKGDRVKWLSTGKTGVVRSQYKDGYVAITLSDGWPAEADSTNLRKVVSHRKPRRTP